MDMQKDMAEGKAEEKKIEANFFKVLLQRPEGKGCSNTNVSESVCVCTQV